jgi:hypothetical protein
MNETEAVGVQTYTQKDKAYSSYISSQYYVTIA